MQNDKNTSQPKNEPKQEKPIVYVISILHKKPEFGEDIHFCSTYYAKEKKAPSLIKQLFNEAFRRAHPSWIIEEITVRPSIQCS